MAVTADVHMRASEKLLAPGAAPRLYRIDIQGLQSTVSELGLMVSCVEPTASTKRIFGCFLGTWNSFLQEALYHPKDIGVPSTFRGGMAAWLGVRVFRMVEVFTGFCMPCVPPEAGAKSHRASVLYCELTIGGLGMWRKRVVLRN